MKVQTSPQQRKLAETLLENFNAALDLLKDEFDPNNPENYTLHDDRKSFSTFVWEPPNQPEQRHITLYRRSFGCLIVTEYFDTNKKLCDAHINISHTEYADDVGEACVASESLTTAVGEDCLTYMRHKHYTGAIVENLTMDLPGITQTETKDDILAFDFDSAETLYLQNGKDIAIGSVAFFCEKLTEIKSPYSEDLANTPIVILPRRKIA